MGFRSDCHRRIAAVAASSTWGPRHAWSATAAVRLGVAFQLPGLCPLNVINELLVLTQPAHLQRAYGGELSPAERNVYRAQLVRERLVAAEPGPGPSA